MMTFCYRWKFYLVNENGDLQYYTNVHLLKEIMWTCGLLSINKKMYGMG
jgi:hypothetical protein